ncbi:hypothetical protein BLNAU_19744 [Blattamonas nauphoetae]|uniref:Uncharacterized protein n=1 Tax=Blattamonas nauphoetae TaxID=2049346 RepID=A0ABQ9X4W2_9EUKA|nr:hypothetical protein BLNAU_19744 [Blattamonas nauphoetae]
MNLRQTQLHQPLRKPHTNPQYLPTRQEPLHEPRPLRTHQHSPPTHQHKSFFEQSQRDDQISLATIDFCIVLVGVRQSTHNTDHEQSRFKNHSFGLSADTGSLHSLRLIAKTEDVMEGGQNLSPRNESHNTLSRSTTHVVRKVKGLESANTLQTPKPLSASSLHKQAHRSLVHVSFTSQLTTTNSTTHITPWERPFTKYVKRADIVPYPPWIGSDQTPRNTHSAAVVVLAATIFTARTLASQPEQTDRAQRPFSYHHASSDEKWTPEVPEKTQTPISPIRSPSSTPPTDLSAHGGHMQVNQTEPVLQLLEWGEWTSLKICSVHRRGTCRPDWSARPPPFAIGSALPLPR